MDTTLTIRYADNILLTENTESKLQEFPDKPRMEEKYIIISCKMKKNMVVKKRNRLRCEIRTGNVEIKYAQKFK